MDKKPRKKLPIRMTIVIEGEDEASVVASVRSILEEFLAHKKATDLPPPATLRWTMNLRRR